MSADIPACHGVTLEQYAGVTAALADEFPLQAALAMEDLDEASWRRAARTWKDRLATGGVDGPLFVEFQRNRIAAEDWLERPVVPIADDLQAWLSFLHAWSTHPAPFDLLAGAKVRMADVARLQRRWSRRLEGNDDLQTQAKDIVARGAGQLPPITVGATELRPFPWSRGARVQDVAKRPGLPSGGVDALSELSLDRYASLCAELAEPSSDRARVVARFSVDEARFAALDAAWKQRLDGDERQARDYRRLFDHQRARLRAAALGGTSLALDVPRGPALPFVEGLAPPAVASPSNEPLPKRPAAALGGTSLAVEVPCGPALPFAGTQEPAREASTLRGTSLSMNLPRGPALPFAEGHAPPALATPSGERPPKPPLAGLAGTSLAVEAPRGPSLPFAGAQEPVGVPRTLGGTSLAVEVPRRPALPFVEGQAPRAVAEPAREELPKRPAPALGGTSLSVSAPQGPTLPFTASSQGDVPPATRENKLARTRVFELPEHLRAKSPAAPSVPAPPPIVPLTLAQYASLCVELAAAPNRGAEILARYRLTTPQRDHLDRHFQERFTREPAVRAEWERACATYRAWLATRSPP